MTVLLTTRYLHKSPFALEAIGLDMPVVEGVQVNRTPFRAILTRIDEPSTRPPNGSSGHKVLIPRAVAEEALPTLLGMGIDVAGNFKDHAKQTKIGVITEAHIEGKDLVISGHLYDKDFSEEVAYIKEHKASLGASYEISDVGVEDTDAIIWTLTHVTFTGAAILRKDAAAYSKTAIAAQTEEGDLMPGEAAAILDELKKLGRQIDAATDNDDDDEDMAAARKDEDDAKRKDEDAKRARDEDDEEDARKHEEDASRLRLAAAKKHDDAAAKRHAEAKKHDDGGEEEAKKREEDAAKRHEAEAKRLRDEDEAAAKRRAEDDEDAKRRDDGGEEDANAMMPALFAMLLKGMGYGKGKAADAARGKKMDDEDEMAKMLGRMFMKSMAYPGAVSPAARRRSDAAHDDTAEDIALFKRLMQQHDKMDAGRGTGHDDLEARRLRRQLRDMQAAMELITDTLKKQSGLITDLVHKQKNLATDAYRPGQGGPVRRTMAATGLEQLVGPFDRREGDDKQVTLAQIDAALDTAGLPTGESHNQARLAKKLEALEAGLVKTS